MVTAYYLLKRSPNTNVTLFEKEVNLGGLIATKVTGHGLVETAANGFLNSAEVEELFSDLNIAISTQKKLHKKRYIFRKKLKSFPFHVSEIFRLALFFIKFKLFRNSVRPSPHETLENWGQRSFGHAFTKEILEVGLQGLYGGDSKHLHAALVIPPFSDFAVKVRKPKMTKGTVAPLEGMGFFIFELEKWLFKNGCKIEKNCEISSEQLLEFRNQGDQIVLAQSVADTAILLKEISDPRGRILENVAMKGLVSCTCFYKTHETDIRGFGVLFEEENFLHPLGVLFNHDIFPQRDNSFRSETSIFSESAVMQSGEDILKSVKQMRKQIGQQEIDPLSYSITKWPKALPIYGVELEKAILLLEVEHKSIYLIGNYLGNIGLAKILVSAKKIADQICQSQIK